MVSGERHPAQEGRADIVETVENRVLVLAPTGQDGALTAGILTRHGFHCKVCRDGDQLCREMETGAGVVLLAEEVLTVRHLLPIQQAFESQPAWSDLPVVVFTLNGEKLENVLGRLGPLGNVTILERPVRITTLVSAVRTGLRARSRQYEVRNLLARLEEADRRKDEFLAMLGHELRNPLAAIRNALLVIRHNGPVEEPVARQLEVIHRQTHLLSRLVDDMLDVSRVTMGKINLQQHRVDLREIVERAVKALRGAAEERRHRVLVLAGYEPLLVEGDPVRLEQITVNLVNNAIKYTPPGGEIQVSAQREGREAVLRVQDSGVGIPPEMLSSIFELFTQVGSTLDRSQGGLGLGLTLVRTLVELHGGRVAVRSDGVGCGSEFIVRLPLVSLDGAARDSGSDGTGTHAESSGRAVSAGNPDTRRRILVIEDNEDGRETLRDLLEMWGHEVEVAADGHAGLESFRRWKADIILVDIGLPGIDGYQVAERLRSEFGDGCARLIAMTGYGQPDDRARALEAGFDVHMVKPIDPDDLTRLLAG